MQPILIIKVGQFVISATKHDMYLLMLAQVFCIYLSYVVSFFTNHFEFVELIRTLRFIVKSEYTNDVLNIRKNRDKEIADFLRMKGK